MPSDFSDEELAALLAASAAREQAPQRDTVPGAVKRLRLRRHAIVNANEFLGSLVALVRGLAGLFAVGDPRLTRPRERLTEDDRRG